MVLRCRLKIFRGSDKKAESYKPLLKNNDAAFYKGGFFQKIPQVRQKNFK